MDVNRSSDATNGSNGSAPLEGNVTAQAEGDRSVDNSSIKRAMNQSTAMTTAAENGSNSSEGSNESKSSGNANETKSSGNSSAGSSPSVHAPPSISQWNPW